MLLILTFLVLLVLLLGRLLARLLNLLLVGPRGKVLNRILVKLILLLVLSRLVGFFLVSNLGKGRLTLDCGGALKFLDLGHGLPADS